MAVEAGQPADGERFGDLLRRHRVAAALSQEALAERAGVSTRAISDMERGVKTRPHLETVRLLAEALDLDPTPRAALISSASYSREPRTQPAPPVAPFHLPLAPTQLVGRQDEVASIRELLTATVPRIVTLTGPGGVGKTTLALEAAAATSSVFPDGVCFVSLASVTDPDLVVIAVAHALGVRETKGVSIPDALQHYLADKRLLLVLDNFEHVLPAAQRVADLLASCVDLKVLATSRAPLRLRGERRIPVPPLPVPNGEPGQSFADVARTASVQLFVARAQDVRPEFTLTEGNVDAVVGIAQHLDGLPLALELTAARVTVLSPALLLARLSDQLSLLTAGHRDAPERHQTMRAAIAWSYDLLSPEEQWLFRRLATFVGGATLEAMTAVTGEVDPVTVLEGVQALADQSLLVRTEQGDGQPRFRMLEPIREFALERLIAESEEGKARDAHAAWCLTLGERTFAVLRGSGRAEWFDRMEAELANLRRAFTWLVARDRVEDAVDLAMGMFFFFQARGYQTEARALFEGFLKHPRIALPTRSRAKALLGSGILLSVLGNRDRALGQLHESLGIFRRVSDPVFTGLTLVNLGNTYGGLGELDHAIEANREVITIGRETNDTWLLRAGLINLGVALRQRGTLDEAVPLFEEALAMARMAGDIYGIELGLMNLAEIFVTREEYAQAAPLLQEALPLLVDLGHKHDLASAAILLAKVAQGRGEYASAAAHLKDALETARSANDTAQIGISLVALGDLARVQGQYDQAMQSLREGIALFHRIGDRVGMIEALDDVAGVAVTTGNLRQAARLLGAADALLEAVGIARTAEVRRKNYERHVRAVRDALDNDAFTAVWSEGHALTLDDATAEALAFAPDAGAFSPEPPKEGDRNNPGMRFGLTPREREVLHLVAAGHSDRSIADALSINLRTASNHVSHIFAKLDVTSRTEAAIVAVRNGLA